jgi:Domain of unknown function (DUF6894)
MSRAAPRILPQRGSELATAPHVLGDGSAIDDDEGTVLSGPDVAMLQAAVIAAELAQDGGWYKGYVVRVTDQPGGEIGRVPVVTATADRLH